MNKPDIYKKIAIALEGKAERDEQIIKGALPFLKTSSAKMYLIHCVETVTGRFIGDLVADERAKDMTDYVNNLAGKLNKDNFVTQTVICGGEPEDEIARICRQEEIELLIVGSHGHKLVSDIIYGSTANEVRHRVRIPVLAIPVEI
jgi:manganese transport protein